MFDVSPLACKRDQSHVVPLDRLRAGQKARIDGVQGPEDWVHRLRELGLCDGAEVCMLRQGNTCMIRLGLQTLCFRGDECTRVLVRLGAAGTA